MRITIIDDTVAFDGRTPSVRALGGGEKAVAGLAAALAARDHAVTVVNRCDKAKEVNGVIWSPWDAPRPPAAEITIAQRDPRLFEELPEATASILWYWGHPKRLNQPEHQVPMERYQPIVAFVGENQKRLWRSWRDFIEVVIPPGVGLDYIRAETPVDHPDPVAIMTTHPLHGMTDLVRIWREKIISQRPEARLHIYSASLAKAMAGSKPMDGIAEVFEEVREAAGDGVVVKAPGSDAEMATAYASARLHLYPFIPSEMYGSTLAESQAAGLPALVLQREPDSASAERVHNGRTGYLVPDMEAVANLALELLSNNVQMYEGLHRDARILQTARKWESTAIEFEGLWS